ncbi:MAG: hypothetical protein JW776_05040 [Candidatus Lokiarchaeota archaeon]|nr:hypothetical protein [Candidatus Lokiarchaeota archaeon]
MAKSKSGIMIAVVVGILVVAAGVLVPLYYFVWRPQSPNYPTWDLKFYGDSVDQSKNITYQEIQEEFSATEYSFNHTRWWDPDGYLSEIRNYTGIPLWDIIEYSEVDYGHANALRFVALDGFKSPALSLDVVENDKSLIIVCIAEEGVILTGPEEDGEGYLMSAVNYSIDETKKSSHFNMKNLIGVEFLVDWDLTLFGETYVETNITISYNDFVNSAELDRHNVLLNYTKLWDNGTIRSSELVNVTGVTLWSIIQYTEVNYTTASGVKFIANDEWSTWTVSLDWVEENASKVLIVYEENGQLLDHESDGYLYSMVDYSLTEGTSSSQFKAKFLMGIEFTLFL